MKEHSYNYLFVSHDGVGLSVMLSELNTTGYTRYIDKPYPGIHNGPLRLLQRIHFSRKINRFIELPFKNIWSGLSFNMTAGTAFDKELPFCFIIHARYFEDCGDYRLLLVEYLRKKYKNCKIVLYYSDIQKHHPYSIDAYREYFDAAATFDRKDAQEYGMLFIEEPFTPYPIDKGRLPPPGDVTFIGAGKTRLKDILRVFEILREHNLICDFHIVDVPSAEQKYSDEITYNRHMSFIDVLHHAAASKCILELIQEGGSSPTTRVSEAICYGKKLLSNCRELKTKPYYNPGYISVFASPEDIDIDFIKRDAGVIDYNYIQNLSPLKMIEKIENFFDPCRRG